jgi:radical SAM superfamily enzyme YgiQ (UPF0313 family)
MRAAGWSVRLIDAAGERLSVDVALQRATQQAADITAVQMAHVSLANDIAFISHLCAASPRPRILAIGASAAFAGPALLERTAVDHVLIGEPEAMLLPACADLAGGGSLNRTVAPADLAMTSVQDGRLADLDSLPHPDWDTIPWQRHGFLTICTSRGCDDTCTFCPYVIGQGRWLRRRDPMLVAEEMAWLATAFQPPRVIVRDPVFAHDRSRVEQICQRLIESGAKLAWECESRPEHFDADLLRLIKRAGCTTVKLGFETTSESLLRNLRRIPSDGSAGVYVQQTADVVAACHTLGIACRLFLMTGLPGQTDEDVAQTIAFLKSVRPTAVHVKEFHRYPGLPMQAGDSDEERQRGERHAAILQEVVSKLKPTSTPPTVRGLRRWLRKRLSP